MSDKQASSEAAWALITEGVTSARLEAHRLQHLVNRALQLVEASKHKEHLHQIAGDLITAVPKRLRNLEQDLDRTSLALSKMGETYLSARLPLNDKTMVEEAIDHAGFPTPGLRRSTERVVARWRARKMRDLNR